MNYHKRPWSDKDKNSGGFMRNTLDNRPGAMNSVEQMIPAQPVSIPQVTGELNHSRFWAATVFMENQYSY